MIPTLSIPHLRVTADTLGYKLEGWDELDRYCRGNIVLWNRCAEQADYYDMTEVDRLRLLAASYAIEYERVTRELYEHRMKHMPFQP